MIVSAEKAAFFDSSYVVAPNGCFIWTECTNPSGYGRMYIDGKRAQAHRVGYTIHVGDIAEAFVLDHICEQRNCVNWRHLEPVTFAENGRRRGKRATLRKITAELKESGRSYQEILRLLQRTANGNLLP